MIEEAKEEIKKRAYERYAKEKEAYEKKVAESDGKEKVTGKKGKARDLKLKKIYWEIAMILSFQVRQSPVKLFEKYLNLLFHPALESALSKAEGYDISDLGFVPIAYDFACRHEGGYGVAPGKHRKGA